MLIRIEPPSRTTAPTAGECLDQVANRAEAIGVGRKIECSRRPHRLRDHGLRQHQITGERIEYVLPWANRVRVAQRDRRSGLKSADQIVHNPKWRPIPAADDVARPHGRDAACIGEEAFAKRPGDELGASLGVAVGITAAQAVALAEWTASAVVFIYLVARYHDHRTHARYRAHGLKHVGGSHYI